jgi:hypothetical protein
LFVRIPTRSFNLRVSTKHCNNSLMQNSQRKATICVLGLCRKKPNFLYETFTDKKNKQTPWPLVRERTIPTDRPPLVDEI